MRLLFEAAIMKNRHAADSPYSPMIFEGEARVPELPQAEELL